MQNIIEEFQIKPSYMKKLMAICPTCGKMIFGQDLKIENIEKSSKSWPKKYSYRHSHRGFPEHVLTMLIDANFSVRDIMKTT